MKTANEVQNQPILVIGSTGKTGKRVAERLTERHSPVRACGRTSAIPFDWEKGDTWEPALRGTSAAYITYAPDLAVPRAADQIAALAAQAVALGVRRLVLLSGRGEPGAQQAEQALQATGADWTILRSSWFAQNFSEGFLLEPMLAGEVALPVGNVREPFIDADDIADAAVAVLTDERHIGQLYEITGPRSLTFAEAIGEIATASGRAIRYANNTPLKFRSSLEAQGLPESVIALMLELFTEVLHGRNAHPTDGVQRVLGRPPRDFSRYARAAATTGTWAVRP